MLFVYNILKISLNSVYCMSFFKNLIAIITTLALSLGVWGCANSTKSLVFTAFNSQVTVCVYSKSLSKQTQKRIKACANDIENRFSVNAKNSLVSKINSANIDQPVNLAEDEYQVLLAAKTAHQLSGGKFDPTVYPLVKLWKFAPYEYILNYQPPLPEQIQEELTKVDFDSITVTEQKTVIKTNENTQIDLGGIVKGFAADKIAEILKESGHNDGYVSVGSSSLNLLSVENLGIRHPRSTSKTLLTVNFNGQKNLSVSTSGDYEKFHLSINGQKYCHIIDPETGYPANTGIASATLLGVDGALSDALTTALCLKNYSPNADNCTLTDFTKTILQEYPTAWIFIVYEKDGQKILLTNKTPTVDFTLNDNEYVIKNI